MIPNPTGPPEIVQPHAFALLLLASGSAAPRQRARDQQADHAGLELRRRVLEEVVALDPEPEEMEAALMDIVENLGEPTGPARSVALALLEEWRISQLAPGLLPHLLDEALLRTSPDSEGRLAKEAIRRGRQLPG